MHSKLDKTALAVIVGYVLVLIFVGWKVHVMETPNSAENDGYAGKAERIMGGEIPRDLYHPLFYPILAATVGRFAGNAFAGGRIVSSLCAGLLALMTYLVGRKCYGGKVGFLALIALLINDAVITMGMEAATDMTFAALALTILFLCVRVSSNAGYRDTAGLGVVCALALFTRYTAFSLLPAVIAAVAFSFSKAPVRRRVLVSLLFAVVVLAVLTPHFILTERVFGKPWYSESWRNVALKMRGDYDWSYFRSVRSEGLLSTVFGSPGRFVLSFFREVARFFHSTLRELGGGGFAGVLFAAAALVGFCGTWFNVDRRKLIVVLFAAGYVAFNCMFFYSGLRFMLPILPLGYLWGGAAMLSRPLSGSFRVGKLRIARSLPVIALFMLVLSASSANHLRDYVHAHPVRELEAARFIERRYGDDVTVLGTFPFMQRYVKYRYVELPDGTAAEIDHPAAYVDRLRANVAERGADFVIIGKLFLKNRPLGLLSAKNPPDFLEPIVRNEDVVVYRVRKESTE